MDDRKLQEMYEMVRENNAMLRSMRTEAMVGRIIMFVWWFVILIVLPYVTWIFIQPYLTSALTQIEQVQTQAGQARSTLTEYQNLLKDARSLIGQ